MTIISSTKVEESSCLSAFLSVYLSVPYYFLGHRESGGGGPRTPN